MVGQTGSLPGFPERPHRWSQGKLPVCPTLFRGAPLWNTLLFFTYGKCKQRTSHEISERFVFDIDFGFIRRGVASGAAPLLARRRAVATGQIAFDRSLATTGDGGAAP